MRDRKSELLAAEQLWGNRLKDAQLRLDFARNFLREVERDFPKDAVPSPDGNFAREKALCAESAALAEYKSILSIFTDLVIHGKTPAQNEWPQRLGAGAWVEGEEG